MFTVTKEQDVKINWLRHATGVKPLVQAKRNLSTGKFRIIRQTT